MKKEIIDTLEKIDGLSGMNLYHAIMRVSIKTEALIIKSKETTNLELANNVLKKIAEARYIIAFSKATDSGILDDHLRERYNAIKEIINKSQ